MLDRSTSSFLALSAHICATDRQVKYINETEIRGRNGFGFGLDFNIIGMAGSVNSLRISDEFEDAGGGVADAYNPDLGNLAGGGTFVGTSFAPGQIVFTHRIRSDFPVEDVTISGINILWAGDCLLDCCTR
jgi:hypothetical protein